MRLRANLFCRITVLLVGVTIVSSIFLGRTIGSVRAEGPISTNKSVNATVRVGAACTLEGTVDTIHTATMMGGVYQQGIGETTLKANCNDSNGFAIYAIGYTDDTFGKTVMTTSAGEEYSINTGIATSGNNSNWAMKLLSVSNGDDTAVIQNGFDSYRTVPESWTMVASKNSATSTLGGVQIKSTYAVYISNTQVAGTYEGKVRYVLMNPATEIPLSPQNTEAGKICYYANASTALGTMGCQDVTSEVTLLASNFSRGGYGFAGWSDVFDYAGNAKFYGPNETITIPDTSIYTGEGKGLSLYAVWVKSEGSLQDSTKVASLCGTNGTDGSLIVAPTDGTADLSSVSALTDQRDNHTYAIARLADGKCWMIENLRLDNTDSDNGTGAFAQGYYPNFIGLSSSESSDFFNSTTANDLYTTESNIQGKITISGTYSGYRFPRYNNINTSARASTPTTNSGSMYHYGNYYTWAAALANTTYYLDRNTQVDGKTSETVGTSLCPKGWRLPYGGNSGNGAAAGGFYNLNYKINDNSNVIGYVASLKLRSYPNNFVYSGSFQYSNVLSRGANGCYWSSTAGLGTYAIILSLSESISSVGNVNVSTSRGCNIRCVSDLKDK